MATEKRLIDANVLRKQGFLIPDFDNAVVFVDDILKAPTVDAVEVVHGRWAFIGESCCVCSVCHKHAIVDYYYCPNCGAKMDGDANG